ncbi:MAG TPA: DUF6520 family protein [Cyclobacteriaceae bacterium]|nr:DUF6520 family protein [Cyclobacteriaceae bacterium]HRF32982.1 DUF6520 family protein [Cyclobacteriaceae bacterium]
MKKVRITLSALAVILAVSVTFAMRTTKSDFLVDGWEFVQGIGGDPDECIEHRNLACDTSSNSMCEINGNPVGNSSSPSSSACGTQYKKP